MGMSQALGGRFLDVAGWVLGPGGGELHRLARIDRTGLDPRLLHTPIDVAVNWHNVLLGEHSVARVFGPQKGATAEQVALLEAGLEVYARRIEEATAQRIGLQPGSGASGGLGAAFMALLGARLRPRFSTIMQYLEFEALLSEADLVVSAEGTLDGQSVLGKVPCEVARRAKRRGIPVIALAGTIGAGVSHIFAHGIDAFVSILRRPCTLDEAIADAVSLIECSAEDALRMVAVGIGLSRRYGRRRCLCGDDPSPAAAGSTLAGTGWPNLSGLQLLSHTAVRQHDRVGSCVTSIAGPHGAAQLCWR
jgi:glycerate kinase